ncbi:hypothetical protein M3N64_04575 [Sporolactobacillus sp. CPB3-1]|uniref:YfhD family protein n=1 Tax=Sporolactobacillus mangiferae TaxID=2940498 RepID=A0ABT0M9B0_9BACL|nr:hypothetical protein [Sporolactobacillus mangiferae]MCL1631223.1 hypothetical protein [Sporolactobacillus mangiferae]
MGYKNEKSSQKESKKFDEEFAQPLDEHSVEERERAQRTGDASESTNFHENQESDHDKNK